MSTNKCQQLCEQMKRALIFLCIKLTNCHKTKKQLSYCQRRTCFETTWNSLLRVSAKVKMCNQLLESRTKGQTKERSINPISASRTSLSKQIWQPPALSMTRRKTPFIDQLPASNYPNICNHQNKKIHMN